VNIVEQKVKSKKGKINNKKQKYGIRKV